MGQRAQDLFHQRKIRVVVGAPAEEPAQLVKRHLEGTLETGGNICDH
jgi:predicted Fe-Mo cluster-binding NifX family protein